MMASDGAGERAGTPTGAARLEVSAWGVGAHTYRVEMYTRSGVYVAGKHLSLIDAERLADAEWMRSDAWGRVRIIETYERVLRVLPGRERKGTGE